MCTIELAHKLNDLPHVVGPEVVTVASKLLTLYPDEKHYSVRYSQVFSHGRFYRPKVVTWSGAWHENQTYKGKRLDIDEYHLHFRQLWRNRCLRQHNHTVEAWPGIAEDVRAVSELQVTWLPIEYPQEDQLL